MPYSTKGEDKKSYIDRFMSSEEAKSDYPDSKQRYAVANSMWNRRKKKKVMKASIILKAKAGLVPVKRSVVNPKTGKSYMITLYVKPSEANLAGMGHETKPQPKRVEGKKESSVAEGKKEETTSLIDPKKSVINNLKNLLAGVDHISRARDGGIVVRRGFFYRHGMDSAKYEAKIKAELDRYGIKYSSLESGENYADFKGGASIVNQSHWWVKIKGAELPSNKPEEIKKEEKPKEVTQATSGIQDKPVDTPQAHEEQQTAEGVRTITPEEWKKYQKHNYAHISTEGQRMILTMDEKTGATVLEPVNVVGLPAPKFSAQRGQELIQKIQNIVDNSTAQKISGVLVDLQTANAITKVYDALSDENKKKFTALPIRKMAKVAWKLVSR